MHNDGTQADNEREPAVAEAVADLTEDIELFDVLPDEEVVWIHLMRCVLISLAAA